MNALLRKLNSATQYPSIVTYHKFGERGRLTDEIQVRFEPDEAVFGTEKIDGTNARIILPPEGRTLPGETDYLIGSRTELLTAQGDIVYNEALGIVDAVRGAADTLRKYGPYPKWTVVFGEVYGGQVGSKARDYSSTNATEFRVFDVMTFDADVLDWPIERIAQWRDNNQQTWHAHHAVHEFANWVGLQPVPGLGVFRDLPSTVEETYEWLVKATPDHSLAVLDGDAMGGIEGLVVRDKDRSRIAKIRFQDYERTLVQRKK